MANGNGKARVLGFVCSETVGWPRHCGKLTLGLGILKALNPLLKAFTFCVCVLLRTWWLENDLLVFFAISSFIHLSQSNPQSATFTSSISFHYTGALVWDIPTSESTLLMSMILPPSYLPDTLSRGSGHRQRQHGALRRRQPCPNTGGCRWGVHHTYRLMDVAGGSPMCLQSQGLT